MSADLRARLRTDVLPRSGIREVGDAVRARNGIIELHGGDPVHQPPASVAEAIEGQIGRRQSYGPGPGLMELREEVGEKLSRVNGITVSPQQVVMTHGAVQACQAVFLACLQPGDEILVPGISWPNYRTLAATFDAKAIPYRLSPRFEVDWEHLAGAFTEGTKILVLTNPSNPTGTIWDRRTVEALAELASNHGCLLVSDEAYDELWFESPPISALSVAPIDNLVGLFSFSKTYAMTGWRVGYAVGPEWLTERLGRIQESALGGLSRVNQAAASAALAVDSGYVAGVRRFYRERAEHASRILGSDLLPVPPMGGLFAFPRLPGAAASRAVAALLDRGVSVVPGGAFGEEGELHVRVSLAVEDRERLVEGLAVVREVATELLNH